MATRRGFLAGLAAAALVPRPTWADVGSPDFLAAAKMPEGDYALVGLTRDGREVFRLPLPDRGHAAAAHPSRAEAVAFARRPGTFAVVIDCQSGEVRARLDAAEGRHFYGHGAYSRDGRLLFTTENDYGANRGMVGVRDATAGYVQIDEFPTMGVGPHEIARMPGTDILVVGNGGIASHPDAGDVDLDIPAMKPNLAYFSEAGSVLEVVELEPGLRRDSIRHLALREDGLVAFAMQWHGDEGEPAPLLGLHRRGEDVRLLSAPGPMQAEMDGYAGSVAFSRDGSRVAISSPPGGQAQVWNADSGEWIGRLRLRDVCGLSAGPDGFTATTGTGLVVGFGGEAVLWDVAHQGAFDNHLVRLAADL
ncbi:DUF1513 domain-containing protein [Rubellimicrobium aerolatum]|uniref:DUF1513 domain-containing protein n=1 Tax=Rubellimicrobium aerolatum TaxID=490979 RepID=A0ABW0SFN4_9RHOB|nr:DUF1513 domain-containing protein [Rubellimicrobium aerolatum]MBP1807273.1 hypothetical protein [Rubellimicrobium aerolatum]